MNDRRSVGAWMAIGIGMGVALGVATNNIGLWLVVGLVGGLVIGTAISRSKSGGA
jgi:hypothetical protein